jgi:Methyltransferase domain
MRIAPHQLNNATKMNRYPRIFTKTVELFKADCITPKRILSFGCSTGEEAVSLSQLYFPTSLIVGVDSSESSIEAAQKSFGELRNVVFCISSEAELTKFSPFDAIFAMSVFCKWPKTENLTDITDVYQFREFEEILGTLDKYLRVSGFFIVANANFRFLDTKLSGNYENVSINIESSGFVKQFDKSHQATNLPPSSDCIYRKLVVSG